MRRKGGESISDLLQFEREARAQGVEWIAGVDEVGRGPLAGPVVAAAVVLPPEGTGLPVMDSKALSETSRQTLAQALHADTRICINIAVVDVACIDRINILQATQRAMRKALLGLARLPDLALVDGLPFKGLPLPARFLVKGDSLSASIAAASIVAKVYRDEIMVAYDQQYPGYGFAQHKGYGTAAHLAALKQLGVSPIHRRSFTPVRTLLFPSPTQPELNLALPDSPAAGLTEGQDK